jgi:hypothetical protein
MPPIVLFEVRKLLGLSSTLIRVTARILVLTLSVTTLGPVLHGAHDEELQAPVGTHDESQHHLQAAHGLDQGPLEAEHCVACHFVRTSRGPVSWEPAGVVAFAAGSCVVQVDGVVAATPAAAPTPSRAPPALV